MTGRPSSRQCEFSFQFDTEASASPPPVCAAFSQLRAAARARHQIEREGPRPRGGPSPQKGVRDSVKLPQSIGLAHPSWGPPGVQRVRGAAPDAALMGESPAPTFDATPVKGSVATTALSRSSAVQPPQRGIHATPLPARLLGLSAHSTAGRAHSETPRAVALRLQRMRASAIRSGTAVRAAAGRVAALPGCWDVHGRPNDFPEPHAVRVLEAMRQARVPSVYRRPSIGPLVSVSRPTPHARGDWLAEAVPSSSSGLMLQMASSVSSSGLKVSPADSPAVTTPHCEAQLETGGLQSRSGGRSSRPGVRAELATIHTARSAQVAALRAAEAAEIASLQRTILDEASRVALPATATSGI